MFLEFGKCIGFLGFSWSRSVDWLFVHPFKEDNDDGVLEIWLLKIVFWGISQEGLLTS